MFGDSPDYQGKQYSTLEWDGKHSIKFPKGRRHFEVSYMENHTEIPIVEMNKRHYGERYDSPKAERSALKIFAEKYMHGKESPNLHNGGIRGFPYIPLKPNAKTLAKQLQLEQLRQQSTSSSNFQHHFSTEEPGTNEQRKSNTSKR